MRLREVFRYELAYRLRSPSTWLFAVFLILVMCWGVGATANGSPTSFVNAPQKVAGATVLFGGCFGLLVSAALFGDAAVRDVAAGMDPLLYTTRLTKTEYLGGRFLAALVVNMLVVVAVPVGHLVAMALFFRTTDAVGPFRLAAYAQPLLFFLWPNLVLVGAILFAIGTRARHVVPVFLGAVGFFIAYVSAANYWEGVDSPLVAALADPLGINAVMALSRVWTPAEQNARLIGLPPLMLANRVLWFAVALALLALLYRTFRFAHADGPGNIRRRRGGRATVDAPNTVTQSPATVTTVTTVRRATGVFGARTRVRQTLAVARRAFGDVLAGRAFPVLFAGAVGVVLLMGWNVTDTVFETSTWPVTQLVAGTVLSQRVVILPWVVLVLFAGELVWRDREVGASEIGDAMPLPTGAALLGRYLALVALIAAVQLAFVLGGALLQLLQGYPHVRLGLYAQVTALNFAEYALLAALAMTVHVVLNQKYVGHVVALLACVFTKAAPPLGLRHHLLVYATDPGRTYSDMNGFTPFLAPIVSFKLYWAAWALLLGVVAVLFWVRGRESGVRRRLALARARFTGPLARAAALGAVLVVALGGFAFYNTNVLNTYRSGDAAAAPQAEYERRYARFASAAQPTITDAALQIELYPERPAAELRGTYRLVNRTSAPIDSVHLYLDPTLTPRGFSFDRPARPALVDSALGYRIFALARPLAPGDSLQLTFDVAFRPRGFTNDARQTDVVANGTYFDRRKLPFVGYQPFVELTDAAERRHFGLAPRPPLPSPRDSAARQRREIGDADRVHVAATIGTAIDQTPVTAGALRRRWTANGRRYAAYETRRAASFGVPVFSARYAAREDRWTPEGGGPPVSLQLLYHPAHAAAVDVMLRAMKASLAYYTAAFGPYPLDHLRIVEVPPYSIFGRAHAGTIAFSEDAFFARTEAGEFDQLFYGAAHEIAHQWQVTGAPVRGVAYLSESFANYSAMMVTEATYGAEAARRAYAFHMERYLQGRVEQSDEVPLLDVAYQTYIRYRKGPIALYTLRDVLGDTTVNGALRRYLTTYRDSGPPYPTVLEQYAELKAVTPDSLRSLLTDLFETVTLWNVKTERATVRPAAGGAYTVSLDVVARKARADSVGRETETPMNDLVEIGVFADGDAERRAPLYLRRHRVRGGRQTITVTVARPPARAGVDPYNKLIDRERGDNVVPVTPPVP